MMTKVIYMTEADWGGLVSDLVEILDDMLEGTFESVEDLEEAIIDALREEWNFLLDEEGVNGIIYSEEGRMIGIWDEDTFCKIMLRELRDTDLYERKLVKKKKER